MTPIPPTTHQRRNYPVENTEFSGFAKRILTAMARRAATDGDIAVLEDMLELHRELEGWIAAVVTSLRADHNYSWTDVGNATGTTRQAAQQRWGGKG